MGEILKFLKIAQAGGQTKEGSFGYRLFSLTISALDHWATVPPSPLRGKKQA